MCCHVLQLWFITFTPIATLILSGVTHTASQNWETLVNSTWDTTTANWFGAVWTNYNDAVFGAIGIGKVSLGTGITAGHLTLNAAGYTVSGGTLTLSGLAVVTANANATLVAAITGSSGLTTVGLGTLMLVLASTYSVNTNVTGGVLGLTYGMLYGGADPAATINVGSEATLQLAGKNTFSLAANLGTGKLYINKGGVLANSGN